MRKQQMRFVLYIIFPLMSSKGLNVKECSNLGAMSGSENSSMEDIAQSFVQVSKVSE